MLLMFIKVLRALAKIICSLDLLIGWYSGRSFFFLFFECVDHIDYFSAAISTFLYRGGDRF